MFPKLVPHEYEDKMFLLASEMVYDTENNLWTIILEPGKELVALNSKINGKGK